MLWDLRSMKLDVGSVALKKHVCVLPLVAKETYSCSSKVQIRNILMGLKVFRQRKFLIPIIV